MSELVHVPLQANANYLVDQLGRLHLESSVLSPKIRSSADSAAKRKEESSLARNTSCHAFERCSANNLHQMLLLVYFKVLPGSTRTAQGKPKKRHNNTSCSVGTGHRSASKIRVKSTPQAKVTSNPPTSRHLHVPCFEFKMKERPSEAVRNSP